MVTLLGKLKGIAETAILDQANQVVLAFNCHKIPTTRSLAQQISFTRPIILIIHNFLIFEF